MTETELKNYIAAIRPADRDAMAAARQRQAQLAKPPGSLGALEDMSVRLAGVTGQVCPRMDKCRVAVFAADNGVVDEGVSCAPRSVTVQQAVNMTRRKTGMSAMAAAFGDDVAVVDVGMAQDPRCAAILDRHIRRTTGNIAHEDAMTRQQALDALAAGIEQAALAKRDGVTALGIGEMGIGNTTPTSALFSAYLGLPVEETVGRGAGLSDEGLERKRDCVRRALRRVGHKNAKQLLFELGGLEIATMAGMFLGAVEEQMPIVIDGAISTAAALAASRILAESNTSDATNSATEVTVSTAEPGQMSDAGVSPSEAKRIAESAADSLPDREIHGSVADVTLASHVSKDGAARKALEALGLRAIIDADMSLGEGSGAVLLMPMLDAALAVYRGMGSFDDIHVEAYHRFK